MPKRCRTACGEPREGERRVGKFSEMEQAVRGADEDDNLVAILFTETLSPTFAHGVYLPSDDSDLVFHAFFLLPRGQPAPIPSHLHPLRWVLIHLWSALCPLRTDPRHAHAFLQYLLSLLVLLLGQHACLFLRW